MPTASQKSIARLLIGFSAAALLAGCASTAAPVIYQPPKTSPAKLAGVEADLARCRSEAEQAVGLNSRQARPVAQGAAREGAKEFVDKAVESLVTGTRNAWERARGAGAGAAAGTLVGVALHWNEPDRVYREYVDLCIKKRGHTVLGWR